MDLEFGASYQRLREEVREFCAAHWPPRGEEAELPPRDQAIRFRQRAIEAGILFRTVPREYGGAGGETDVLSETVIRQELDAARTPHRSSVQGTHMLVPTLLECGTEEQKQSYIAKTLTGELRWCQGYSEPGAGSDLASLQSRAELDGEHWVLNGQKIWTSQATEADMMFGLFRTEPEAQKHAGISYLLVPMDTPGIDARILKMINGGQDFCEVFFDDARVPAANIVGRRGEGWKVSRSTLKHERLLIGDASGARRSFDGLLDLARRAQRGGQPAIRDAGVRQRLAEIEGYVASQEYAVARMLTAIHKNEDMKVMNEMLMAKLLSTNTGQLVARLAMELLGDEGLTMPTAEDAAMGIPSEYTDSYWVSHSMMTLGTAIAGGASNIQRNIIGERLLGLPRDPRKG
ncbi:MAG: acyl-CoA dehydrogenase family protein [Planctomycetota bacterium]|jgi:alkylation response protein AidB-like acyl-CoA dehydrogenase|nr:acyl-CoA dehydrogenase [Deltaproteobacteria bacterium]MDP6540711.1 acyl-CoA dehydrogenase family protein [Planctomycetota bacterium]